MDRIPSAMMGDVMDAMTLETLRDLRYVDKNIRYYAVDRIRAMERNRAHDDALIRDMELVAPYFREGDTGFSFRVLHAKVRQKRNAPHRYHAQDSERVRDLLVERGFMNELYEPNSARLNALMDEPFRFFSEAILRFYILSDAIRAPTVRKILDGIFLEIDRNAIVRDINAREDGTILYLTVNW